MTQVKADYRLIIDNLMDLTHETYVHSSSIGNDALAEAGVAVLSECLRSECGLCLIAVDAHIDHRDGFLGSKEKARDKRLCACVLVCLCACVLVCLCFAR